MKLLLLCLCVTVAHAGLAPLYMAKRRGVPNRFIIKAKDAALLDQVERDVLDQFKQLRMMAPKVSKIRDLLPVLFLQIPSHLLNTIRSIDGIEYVEQESLGELFGQQANPTWGIDRIDARAGTDDMYNYNSNVLGAGVDIYIVDTGVQIMHKEFSKRASYLYGGEDDNGHGTHCGGTAAGVNYGVAREATVHSVKVCNVFGKCITSELLAGLDVVFKNNIGVVSMSLGFSNNPSIDKGVQKLLDAGFVVSVAAGNSNSDACNYTPAHIPDTITVAATDINDKRASFSCFGSCVDIFAPGKDITSAKWSTSSHSATTIKSGTSMACPHVTGAAALYFSKNLDAKAVKTAILNDATSDVITGVKGSPNKLLYTGNI